MPPSQRYFALFGSKGTGKTAYLASLYSSSGDAGDGGPAYHVSASDDPDDPTHRYLGRIGRALKAGLWPDSSPFERLSELKIRFTSGNLARSLVLPDVGGELTKREEQVQLELKKEILAQYEDYQGFLIFIPADLKDPGRAAESKWEVDVLLNVLQERVAEGRTKIARPFAILVTMWDLIEPGPVTEASEARAVAFLESIHPDLISGLRTRCENLCVFPVSATGPLVAGQPPGPLRPTNLGEPIAWLVETAERVMLEGAVAYVEQNRSKLFKRVAGDARRRTNLQIAHERLKHFLDDVPSGPLADEARAEIERLKAGSRRRLKQRAGIASSIVVSLIVTTLGVRDYRAYYRAHDLLVGASPDLARREVVARVNAVLDEPHFAHPVAWALFMWSVLRRDLETYRTDFEFQSFDALERAHSSLARNDEKGARHLDQMIGTYEQDFPDSQRLVIVADFRSDAEKIVQNIKEYQQITRINEDYREFKAHSENLGLASNLRDECEAFLKDHSGSDHVLSVQAIRAKVQALIDTMNRAKNYEELRDQLTRAAESPWRCYQLCTRFLKNDASHPMAREVAVDRDRFLAKADDQAWDDVIQNARTFPSLFPRQIARCEDYMHNGLFTAHQVEASEFKKRANRGYDRASYGAIRTKAGDNDHPATLAAVRKLCAEYLNAPIPGKKMTTDIECWAKWFDGWGQGREFKVRVVSVRIDRESAWHYHTWPSDPWVHASVQVGQKTHSTGAKYIPLGRDVRDLPEDLLGPFTWKWGDPDVVVALTYKDANPPEFPTNFAGGDAFKVRHLNGRATFDGGKIAVRMECLDVVPPNLPPYKD